MSPANFEWQLAHLAASRPILSLEQYVEGLRGRGPLAENGVILTFDDGYKDNFTTVYPLPKRYGIPATFFLSTAGIGGVPKWEDQLGYALFNSVCSQITVRLDGHLRTFRLRNAADRTRGLGGLLHWLTPLFPAARVGILAQVYERCRVNSYPSDPLMLDWDEVRQMAATPGISFGAHTVSHPRLAAVSYHQLHAEVSGSKQKIEQEIRIQRLSAQRTASSPPQSRAFCTWAAWCTTPPPPALWGSRAPSRHPFCRHLRRARR